MTQLCSVLLISRAGWCCSAVGEPQRLQALSHVRQPSWFTTGRMASIAARRYCCPGKSAQEFCLICSCVAKTFFNKCHLLLLFIYQVDFARIQRCRLIWEDDHVSSQSKGTVYRQKTCKVIKWLAYGPQISQGLGQNQGCPTAITFIYHHITLLLASFRGFGLLCAFLHKTAVEKNKDK